MRDLLALQQRLIEDLPEDVVIGLCPPGAIEAPHLRFTRGRRTLYLVAPTDTSVSYKRSYADDWFNCSYETFISSASKWIDQPYVGEL